MKNAIAIIVVRETSGWAAASPDLPEFVLMAASFAEIAARLPEALQAHCGQRVAFETVLPRVADLD
jgi:predicted RNase H-like HicB family nuclease